MNQKPTCFFEIFLSKTVDLKPVVFSWKDTVKREAQIQEKVVLHRHEDHFEGH